MLARYPSVLATREGADTPSASATRLRGRRLLLARALWLSAVFVTLAIFIGSLPVYVAQLHTPCMGTACTYQRLTAGQVQLLQELGWSLDKYAALQVVLMLMSVVVGVGVSTLIVWRRSDDRMAMLVALWLVTGAPMIATTSVAASSSPWNVPTIWLSSLSLVLSLFVFLLFPSGKLAPTWMRWCLLVFLGIDAIVLLRFYNAFVIQGIAVSRPPWLAALGELAVIALAQVHRYRRVSTPLERQQTKWVVFGLAVPIIVVFIGTLLGLIPALAEHGSPFPLVVDEMGFLLAFSPLSFGIAILRYRLWDIDVIIRRTVVYAALTACVIGVYVLIVGYLGAALRVGSGLPISLVATGVVAVLFQPLRDRLQHGVDRLLFGERGNPYGVLARLDARLAQALPAESVLPTIVETVAAALKLPHVAITLVRHEAQRAPIEPATTARLSDPEKVSVSPPEERVAAVYGTAGPAVLRLPLVYGADTVGYLYLTARPGETGVTPADRRLLEDLAAHAGVVAHAVRLTSDLQHARERLVTAREEERRRLRRDLHDGLGPQLASLTLTLTAAREFLERDPTQADALLRELTQHVQGAIGDVRRLVYELRPPALDDLGLVGALRDQAARYSRGGLDVRVEATPPLAPLPAAVEVAAYRVALEALANVARHAHARHCVICLTVDRDLTVEVSDDGIGIAPDAAAGVGLRSMRERAEELGGSLVVAPLPEGGTRVRARWPFPEA
jgi:signal transduction histidine kinase